MSDDLVAFLRERLDEEQGVAERTQPGPWIAVPATMPGEMEIRHQMPDGRPDVAAAVATTHGLYCSGADAAHIARYHPARVLAEVAAKRRIVDLHTPKDTPGRHLCPVCVSWETWRSQEPGESLPLDDTPCDTLRLLALPYAEHEAYRPEWAP